MSTGDHYSANAQLESALAAERGLNAEQAAKLDLRATAIEHLERDLEAEKASHTDTLVKLRLTEERLASSEAERLRLTEISQLRKRDSIEAEQALYRVHMLVTGKNTVPGNYAECEREIGEAIKEDYGILAGSAGELVEFIREHGDELLFMLNDGAEPVSRIREAIRDKLESLMLAIDLDAHFSDDDLPTEPMAAKEPG